MFDLFRFFMLRPPEKTNDAGMVRHNPGAMWRSLALEEKTSLVTMCDSDRAPMAEPDILRTEEMVVRHGRERVGTVLGLVCIDILQHITKHRPARSDRCPAGNAARKGVLSFVPCNARSQLLPLDIEYVTWANPRSEVVYFSAGGCCGTAPNGAAPTGEKPRGLMSLEDFALLETAGLTHRHPLPEWAPRANLGRRDINGEVWAWFKSRVDRVAGSALARLSDGVFAVVASVPCKSGAAR